MANVFKNDEQRKKWNTYNNKYAKKNYKSICLKLNKNTDKDIIDYLTSNGGSPTQVIKALVKEKLGTGS